jgi:hypothetical protein
MEGEESVTARWRSGRGFWFVAPCLFVSLQLQLEGVKRTVEKVYVKHDLQPRLYVHASLIDS